MQRTPFITVSFAAVWLFVGTVGAAASIGRLEQSVQDYRILVTKKKGKKKKGCGIGRCWDSTLMQCIPCPSG
jgi:hypothetical protein